MRDNKTANTLHLVDVLQATHGPHPTGRADLVSWISAELDKTPGDDGVRRLIAAYPAHRAALDGMLGDMHSTN
jgi:hypothetical protein